MGFRACVLLLRCHDCWHMARLKLVIAPLTNETKGYIILDVLNAYKCILHLYAFMYKERKAGQRRNRRMVMGCKELQES